MTHLPENPEEVRMPFSSHLEELRKRLFRSLLIVGVLFMGGWMLLKPQLQAIFIQPHKDAVAVLVENGHTMEDRLSILSAAEPVFFDLKVSLLAALLIGLPWVIWEIWSFIAVGLFPKERKVISSYIPFGLLSGVAGTLFGYFFMIPTVLRFLYEMVNPDLMVQAYRLSDYFSIFMMFTIALALVFQLPLILLGLGAAGLVDAKTLSKYRRHFILGAFVVAAMVTPPDPFSQALMAAPTILLYELGILLVRLKAPSSLSDET
jgi:Tat protein translocase TatC